MRVAGKMGRSQGSQGVSHRLSDTVLWRRRATYSGDLVGTEGIVRSRADVRGGIALFAVEHPAVTGTICRCHDHATELAPARPAQHIRAPPPPASVCLPIPTAYRAPSIPLHAQPPSRHNPRGRAGILGSRALR